MPLPVPPDLEEALARVPTARARFDRLPSEGKDAWIAWIERSRVAGGRRRRIATAVRRLGAGVVREEELDAAGVLPPGAAWWPWALGLALLAVVAGLLVWQLGDGGGGNDRSGAVVISKGTVPNLVGQPLATARRYARAADLRPVVARRISDRPRGFVVDQSPQPGVVVRSGAPMTLVVSKGPPPRPVPDVTGIAAADAARQLRAARFLPKLVVVASAKPAGTVLSQRPAARTRARPGARVTLVVAKGPAQPATPPPATATTGAPPATTRAAAPTTTAAATQPPATTSAPSAAVAVPSLVGKGLATALAELDRLGLLATVEYQSSQTPLGQVRGQNPSAGAHVPPGSRVQVNVSEGPKPGNPAQVPDVTGQSAADAQAALQDAGFQPIVVHTRRQGQAGTVIEQQPAAGTAATTDDYVALYVPGG